VKLRKRLAELQSAEAAAENMVSRLRSILSTVNSFRQITSASIQQLEQEAKSLRIETKKRIGEIAQILEEEKKLADELNSVLFADE
jgi:Asp-tRNA(Asn)/Glu-tRNA(Gln) amidotransferase C subunit